MQLLKVIGCMQLVLMGLHAEEKEAEEIFTTIYDTGYWGVNAEGIGYSGTGSTVDQARPYMKFVQDFMAKNAIKSVVDVGCGDWTFARHMNWNGIDYIGYDVVQSVIERDKERFATDNINFIFANAIETDLPSADLLICKDVLQHCNNDDIASFLLQCPKFKHCLITNDVNPDTLSSQNFPTERGGCTHAVDLTQPPFNVEGVKVLTYQAGYNIKQVLHIQND
ncbi:MAG: class I SAM-dependent methyltransferase [Parachlamydiaceae bacterium]|nr:class I SAM-dependent methyltransferase [Parachlamydiaceae bacterium]